MHTGRTKTSLLGVSGERRYHVHRARSRSRLPAIWIGCGPSLIRAFRASCGKSVEFIFPTIESFGNSSTRHKSKEHGSNCSQLSHH